MPTQSNFLGPIPALIDIGWITFRVITVGQDEWMDTGDDNPDTAINTCAPSELRMSIT